MKRERSFIKYLMLNISIVMLILYILPHHHHHDGMACYSLTEETESVPQHSNDSHTCNCTGHHLFIKNTIDNDNTHEIIPHYFLLAIVTDLKGFISPICLNLPFRQLHGIYLEKLQDTPHVSCHGLRAPPFLYR